MRGFTKIRRGRGGYVAEYLNDAGGEASGYVMNVVSALVSPTGFVPGYYLTLGILFEQTPSGLFKIMWMEEKESLSQSDIITGFIDSALRLCVETVYVDREANRGFFENIHNSGVKTYAPWRLMPAPSSNDVLYGISLINQYIAAAAINCPEGSIFFKQLTDIGITDQKDVTALRSRLEDPALYVFHALRHILAGMERDIMPVAKPGNVYNLQANKFYKPSIYNRGKDISPVKESGFFV